MSDPRQAGDALHPSGSSVSSRQRLLEAAKELFAAEGYDSATTAAIARRAETSESQLVKHFGSKEGLLEAIFDAAWERLETGLREEVAQPTSPTSRLLALADRIAGAFAEDPELRRLMLLESRRLRRSRHEVIVTTGFRRFVALVDEILPQMKEAGELRPDLNLQAVRSALMGAFEGLLRDRLLADLIDFPAEYGRGELGRTFRIIVSAVLNPDARELLL